MDILEPQQISVTHRKGEVELLFGMHSLVIDPATAFRLADAIRAHAATAKAMSGDKSKAWHVTGVMS